MFMGFNYEEEMERQAEVEVERELVGWIHKTEVLEDIERSFKLDVLEDIRKNLIDDIEFDDGIDTEDSFRIRCESLMKSFEM
jgi:hypothetical protein